MREPKISIITITYNSERTLERTILSVLEQDYKNLEYIIIDGASEDGTLNIIKKYGDKINRWISEPDKGISDAFNKGIRMSTGEIIGIINSDDGYYSGAIKAVAEAYEPDIDVYRGDIMFWNTETGAKILEVPSMHFPPSSIKINMSHQGTFVTKKAYERYGMFNTDYRTAMDLDLMMRFERQGAKFRYIDRILAYFTMDGVTFKNYTNERRREDLRIRKENGAKLWHLIGFLIIKTSKNVIKRFIDIDLLLRIRHRKDKG